MRPLSNPPAAPLVLNDMRKIAISIVWIALAAAGGLWADGRGDAPVNDRRLKHEIHSAIVEDGSLPYCAHRVRVQSEKGTVTLTGKVHTSRQKRTVKEKAAMLAGEEHVVSQIELKKPRL